LLECLARQITDDRFTFDIVVVDNDRARSAELVTTTAMAVFGPSLTYTVEPRQNIALARNRSLAHVRGSYVAFIDDDEFPSPRWLFSLLHACEQYGVDGVLGTVKPHFDTPPPVWLTRGRFYERPSYPTGQVLDWHQCHTANALVKRAAIDEAAVQFRPEYGSGGEDRDFFRRLIAKGRVFVACEQAWVEEVVPPWRWKRRTLLRRALLRGKMSLNERDRRVQRVAMSLVAVPMYAAALPFVALGGQHVWVKFLVRLCDHGGRLLALVGRNPVREVYVTN
jgi:hypothetical protein